MSTAYLVSTILFGAILGFSGLGKLRRDPRIVHVIQDVVGMPLKYFPLLAALEFAGALGLVLGIWWPSLGVAAGFGLILYFNTAIALHLRVDDVKGIGPATFMLTVAVATLVLRILTRKPGL